MSQRLQSDRNLLIGLVLLSAAGFAFRMWRLGDTPLFADEAYYLLWSRALAPGYYDHPSGVAFLLRMSTLLGGAGEGGVRWLNALLSTACVPLVFAVGRRYVSTVGSWVAAIAVALGPVYVLAGRIVYPDSLQYLFLILNLLIVHPLLQRKGTLWAWVLFGLTLGLLLNVKGTSLLYLGSLLMYAVLWRREWFRDPLAWIGAGTALLVFLPWLIWGAQHDWPSLRLAISQGSGFGMERPGLLSSLAHGWRYLTPPAAILAAVSGVGAALGVFRLWKGMEPGASLRCPPAWLFLALTSACILLPMALSAANSPRNLAFGLLPLWPLAALLRRPESQPRARRLAAWALAVLAGWMAVYAVGTVAGLLAPTSLPRSIGADGIRKDAAGWPEFGRDFNAPKADLLYAVDYSIAGQAAYYTGRPVYSSIGQFRFWGVPEHSDWTVLAQGYVPRDLVTGRLEQGFASVSGPERWAFSDADGEKNVYIWRAEGRKASTTELMDALDFLSIAQQAARTSD